MINENEICELIASILTGVTVGIGSLVLLFSSGASILIQCPFQCGKEGTSRMGHGEAVNDSVLFFSALNHEVKNAEMLSNDTLILSLSGGYEIKIYPENNGLESYVVTTSHGGMPIINY